MTNIKAVAQESYQVGATQKFRKEKWAYDRAREHGAVERYDQGLQRMAVAHETRQVFIPGKKVAVESTTVRAGTGQVKVTREVGPVLESVATRTLALSPEARPCVKSVGSPFRAIRAAIEGNANDIRPCSNTFERNQSRARAGVIKADNLAQSLERLDSALLAYAKIVVRGNAKARATFRALCYRLQHFDCPRAALDEINLGERDGRPLPKGAVRTQTFVKDHTYYLGLVSQ